MNKELIIIDDDLPFNNRLSKLMEKKGFNVESFNNINKSIERINKKFFDYAIVDMRLEDGSGLELIKFIKNKIEFYFSMWFNKNKCPNSTKLEYL